MSWPMSKNIQKMSGINKTPKEKPSIRAGYQATTPAVYLLHFYDGKCVAKQ